MVLAICLKLPQWSLHRFHLRPLEPRPHPPTLDIIVSFPSSDQLTAFVLLITSRLFHVIYAANGIGPFLLPASYQFFWSDKLFVWLKWTALIPHAHPLRENLIQPRRQGPIYSYQSCSVVHETENDLLTGFKINPRNPHCGPHREGTLTSASRVANLN